LSGFGRDKEGGVHSGGNWYQVIGHTNLGDRQVEYPARVSYRGPNGKEWSKEAVQWFQKMTPLDEVVRRYLEPFKDQVLPASSAAGLVSMIKAITGEDV
jgi:hypothetical protein